MQREKKQQHTDTFVYPTKTAGCITTTKCLKHPSRKKKKKICVFVAVNSKTRERFSLIRVVGDLFSNKSPKTKAKISDRKRNEKNEKHLKTHLQVPLKQHELQSDLNLQGVCDKILERLNFHTRLFIMKTKAQSYKWVFRKFILC